MDDKQKEKVEFYEKIFKRVSNYFNSQNKVISLAFVITSYDYGGDLCVMINEHYFRPCTDADYLFHDLCKYIEEEKLYVGKDWKEIFGFPTYTMWRGLPTSKASQEIN